MFGPSQIETFDCWVCDTQGMGPPDLRTHECNLSRFNTKLGEFLESSEGRFLTYLAKKMLNASNRSSNTLA